MNNIENLKKYIDEEFPRLKLTRPLFYNSDIGIRFEIGDPKEENDKKYIQGVKERSTKIFEEVFSPESEMFIVIKIYESLGEYNEDCTFHLYDKRQPVPDIKDIIKEYIKDNTIINNISSTIVPVAELDDTGDEVLTTTHCISCKTKDVNYKDLLMNFDYETYFIDKNSGIVYFLYDYRGLDLIANSTQALKPIYKKYNDWILDYDRENIDALFKCKLRQTYQS